MKKMKMFTGIAAALLATITAFSIFSTGAFAVNEVEEKGADVYIGGSVFHFDDIADAWKKAVSASKPSRIVLREDWVADENGSLGEGEGFSGGSVWLFFKREPLTLDLNGFKVDRGLKEARAGGELFYFADCNDITITDSSERQTGLITGGYNKSSAGAIYVIGSTLKLENISLSGNKTKEKGGALFIDDYNISNYKRRGRVTLDNCRLSENEAKTGGAIYIMPDCVLKIFDTEIVGNKAKNDAGVHTEVEVIYDCDIYLGGKVIIADNVAENSGEGLMLDENLVIKVIVKYVKERPLEYGSRIVILSKTDDKTLRITDDSDRSNIHCFEYENGKYQIIEKGSDGEKYLDIKKV